MNFRKIKDFITVITQRYYEWYNMLTLDLGFIGAMIGLSGITDIWSPEMKNSRWWIAFYVGLIACFMLMILNFDKFRLVAEKFYREVFGSDLVGRRHPLVAVIVIIAIAAAVMFSNKLRAPIVAVFKLAAGAHIGFSVVMFGYFAYHKLRQLGRKWFGLGARSGIEIEMTEPEWYVKKNQRMQAKKPEPTAKKRCLKPSGKIDVKVNLNTGEREVIIDLKEYPEGRI